MSTWELWVIGGLYAFSAAKQVYYGNPGFALTFLAYSVSCVGLLIAAGPKGQ